MPFSLPELPYSYDALAPYMSRETLEFHHDKHHLAYVNNGNNLMKGTEFESKPLEDVVKSSFYGNPGLFNNAGQHYNHVHFWKWMKPGRRRQDAGQSGKADHRRSRIGGEDEGGLHPGRRHPVRLRLVLARSQLRQDRGDENAERRKPAGPWREADPRLRRVGALLLYRLPQPAPRLSQGVRRSSGQLGICRRNVLGGAMSGSAVCGAVSA